MASLKFGMAARRLDWFREQGMIFLCAIAQGVYITSFVPSLLTGLYPIRLNPSPSPKIPGVLPGEGPTLAELLKRACYHTATFHSNSLLAWGFGCHLGFMERLSQEV